MACPQTTFNTYVATDGPLPATKVMVQSLEMGSIPAAVMLTGSLVTILSPDPPPKVVAHALQHLAAGIMICAISMELVPPMARAKGRDNIIGLVLGFSLGVLVMIGLSIFLEDAEGDDEEDSQADAAESEALLSGELRDTAAEGPALRQSGSLRTVQDELRGRPAPSSMGEGPKSLVGQAYSLAGSRPGTEPAVGTDSDRAGHGSGQVAGINQVRRPAFPWLFAFCVYVDSVMDGLLVGLALVTGNSAGVFMASAMAVEMGFLGETMHRSCLGIASWAAVDVLTMHPWVLWPCFTIFPCLSKTEPALQREGERGSARGGGIEQSASAGAAVLCLPPPYPESPKVPVLLRRAYLRRRMYNAAILSSRAGGGGGPLVPCLWLRPRRNRCKFIGG